MKYHISKFIPLLSLLFACISVFSACTSQSPQSEIVTENGVEIRLNYRPSTGDMPGSVIPVEEVLVVGIGETDHLEQADLILPRDVAVGSNRQIIVLDTKPPRIVVYSEEGDFLRSFGRQGSGPGEFQEPWCLLRTDRNLVITQDIPPGSQLNYFDLEGQFIKRITPEKPWAMGITEAPDGGYYFYRDWNSRAGDIWTTILFIWRGDELGRTVPFSTRAGEKDTLHVGIIVGQDVLVPGHHIPNNRQVLTTPEGDVIALGPYYSFIRINERGRVSAFRRVSEPLNFPDWYLQEYREAGGDPSRLSKGYSVVPAQMLVDERSHLWVRPLLTELQFVSSREEQINCTLLVLDEFDRDGIWLRQVIMDLPFHMSMICDAMHGFFYGIAVVDQDSGAMGVVRFRQPG